jgi:hypothetical protein
MTKFITDIKTALTRTTPNGDPFEPINRRAGIGAIFGILAGLLGFVFALDSTNLPLGASLQIPILGSDLVQNSNYLIFSLMFFGLLAFGLLLQVTGYRNLSRRIESSFPNISIILFIVILVTIGYYIGGLGVEADNLSQLRGFISSIALVGPIFVIFWQLHTIVFVDVVKSYIGFFAAILNAFFFPVLSFGFVFQGFTFPIILAYLMLLIGQVMVLLFWWSPEVSIREYARSPDTAKFAFGVSGFLTFLIGFIAVLTGPLTTIQGVDVWQPFGSSTLFESGATSTLVLPWGEYRIVGDVVSYATYPWLISSILTAMVFWIMLAPRLGAKELKESRIGEDIVKGGVKYLMVVMAIVGIYAAAQLATYSSDALGLAVFLTICPSAVMFLMGALYAGSTDIITGVPLVVTGIFTMVSPYVLSPLVLIPWILVIITQGFLMIETKIRGFTFFQQSFLTVLVTIVFSALFVAFLLGALGAGPAAIWPANRWFNITFLTDVPIRIQAPTILAIVLLTLMVRNVALVGYAFGRIENTPMVGTLSAFFALLIPLYAGAFSLAHQALTAASIMFALYTISYILVLSQNLELGSKVQNAGYTFEGQFIRVAMGISLAIGAIVALIAFAIFTDISAGPAQISLVITLLITLVTSLEILCFITWLITGIRLNMLKGGFKFSKLEYKEAELGITTAEPEITIHGN